MQNDLTKELNTKNEFFYYKDRKGELYKKATKSEIKEMINPFLPSTFIPLLKDMDYPYLEDAWGQTLAKAAEKNATKTVIGKYIAKMNLPSYRSFTFKNSIYQEGSYKFCLQTYLLPLTEEEIDKNVIN